MSLTYKQFYEAACALVPGPVKVEVQTWNHRFDERDRAETEWGIWSNARSERWRGGTPEEALERCRASLQPAPAPRIAGTMPAADDPCIATPEPEARP